MEKDNEQSAINGTQPEDVDLDVMDEEASSKQKLNSAGDPSKIKFTPVNMTDSTNGEAKVDILLAQTSVGMGKEELMKYANEPFWVRLRMFLFILFWVGWLAMLVGAVVIIVMAPRCPPPPKLEWYQKNTMYQVDVDLIMDSNDDGVGDFKGLMSKLNYFKALNVKTILLNAIYAIAPSTGGIVNYTAVNERYGTMSDFEELVAALKEKDMKVILDFVPNESSDQHPWFIASVKREAPYKDFYVWADGKGSKPPSNWVNLEDEPSWEYNGDRDQYYLNTRGKHHPDLNLRNGDLKAMLEKTMRFWLDKNIDGFKVKSASHLLHDQTLKDEPLATSRMVAKPKYGEINHVHTLDQSDNFELFAEWRTILSNYSEESGSPKILMAELSSLNNDTVKYYGNFSDPLVEFPLNLELTKLNKDSLASDLMGHIDIWANMTSPKAWPNWVLGTKNTKRLVDRVGHDLIDGLYMVAMVLRGTPITYFGDEIAMPSYTSKDSSGIEEIRPMIWNGEAAGGFTNDSSFDIPVSEHAMNVRDALDNKSSHLKIFSHLNDLRNQPAISVGNQTFPIMTENVFSVMRFRKGFPGYLVVFNMGSNSTVVDFSGTSKHLPESGKVEVKSGNIISGILAEGQPKIKLDNVPLEGKQAVVFSFVPKFED